MERIRDKRFTLTGKLLPFLFLPLLLWAFKDELLSIKGMNFPSLPALFTLLPLLLLGSFLNWGLEARKWHLLGKESFGLGWKNAFKGVLVGQSIGMWMPGRVGSWVGKLFFVDKEQRSKALYPLLVSGGAQFIVTFIFAVLALLLWNSISSSFFPVAEAVLGQAFFYAALFPPLAILFYFLIRSGMIRKLIRWSGISSERTLSFKDLSFPLYAHVLGIAALRYLVFLAQFILVLRYWVPELPLHLSLVSVPLVLFMVSVLPSMVLAKLGVREWVMVAVVAPLAGNEQGLILASFSIWAVNLALPALVGVFLLLSPKRKSQRAEASLHAVP